ncbi:GNAT family N-acetyltransferase [Vibrio agarivorans]|uniref:GNAT family N-acetyltransferase n=1 Tax=Vibrio agarivorans TaxID=153622 RepID=UPI00222F37D1|nr:GNAT family N-acetyltransferase [Vibrio agarivorans]MDN3659774.1 GNAT family N-acetyltransferase [Vibrio agarivorans]
MVIRDILSKDLDTILALNEQFVKVLSPMDKSKLLRLLDISYVSVVIEDENQVLGFLIALTEHKEYESINYQWFNDYCDSFLYIDRVVVADDAQGKGIASMLYHYALDSALDNSIPCLCAEIDVLPPNEASLLFHKKMGFKELELLRHSEDKMVSLQKLHIS